MNRVESPHFPDTICGVVGEHRQFAPGVLTRAMSPRQVGPAAKAADAVLSGERYAPVGNAMHFHVAGLRIPYRVQYVAVAGGNAFYLKTGRRSARKASATSVAAAPTPAADDAALAAASPRPILVQKLYDGASAAFAGGQAPKNCEGASSTFGATSLACETDSEGR
jgi:spore germination cell wall hydrolase CwlJ-like protein